MFWLVKRLTFEKVEIIDLVKYLDMQNLFSYGWFVGFKELMQTYIWNACQDQSGQSISFRSVLTDPHILGKYVEFHCWQYKSNGKKISGVVNKNEFISSWHVVLISTSVQEMLASFKTVQNTLWSLVNKLWTLEQTFQLL